MRALYKAQSVGHHRVPIADPKDSDTLSDDLTQRYRLLTFYLASISTAMETRRAPDLAMRCRDLKIFFQNCPHPSDLPLSIFNPCLFVQTILPPFFQSDHVPLLVSILELFDKIFYAFKIQEPAQFLRPEVCERLSALLHLRHDELTAPIIRLLSRMPDGTRMSAERCIVACPFPALVELARTDANGHNAGYIVWEAIACYVRALSETGVPDDQAVSAVGFYVEGLKSANFAARRELIWAVQAVVSRSVVCQAVVDGVPALAPELAGHVTWDDPDVRRGIVLIFGHLAVAGCKMPGYDRQIVLNAMWNDGDENVRCVAVWATAAMILNPTEQDEADRFSERQVREIVQDMLERASGESFLVSTEVLTHIPSIVKSAVSIPAYRAIVAHGFFEALAALSGHTALREPYRAGPVLGMIADIFRAALHEGWAAECVSTFEKQDGWEILQAMTEVEDNKLAAEVEEIQRRIEAWKTENSYHH
jgi:hypothetical protein